MLFSSLAFIFAFLPLALGSVVVCRHLFGPGGARTALTIASLVFYGLWGWKLLIVLVGLATFNHALSRWLVAPPKAARGSKLVLGVVTNLLVLGVFKYANFFLENVSAVTGHSFSLAHIALPVGISFFTFQQIGYLVAVANGIKPAESFRDYLLFVSCFPYVTAGPILAPRELFSQRDEVGKVSAQRLAVGITVFAIGLFKKGIVAEAFAPYANQLFEMPRHGLVPSGLDAWAGSWAYTLQLYFDFSGYSDIALGLGVMLGLRLPINFNSPLRATSAIEFWQRWHITLTRFLTNHLFMPISVKQKRKVAAKKSSRLVSFLRAYGLPVMVTFVLAGLWHGASWTFVLFGTWWGIALFINHGWRQAHLPKPPVALAWLMTATAITIGMVLFRAPDLHTAAAVLGSLVRFDLTPQLAISSIAALAVPVTALCLLAPNTPQIMDGWEVSGDPAPKFTGPRILQWRWSLRGQGLVFTVFIVFALVMAGEQSSTFLYYQF
jgi:D-alanyl-lipoteichoic acid acyltransferase DltB (MBOAT superfamily)